MGTLGVEQQSCYCTAAVANAGHSLICPMRADGLMVLSPITRQVQYLSDATMKDLPADNPHNTPRNRLLQGHRRLCEKAITIMQAKNHDYASDEDPFRNFRAFERFGILVRLSDKLARLQSFLENGKLKVADETIEDTVCDIINYAILFQQYEGK